MLAASVFIINLRMLPSLLTPTFKQFLYECVGPGLGVANRAKKISLLYHPCSLMFQRQIRHLLLKRGLQGCISREDIVLFTMQSASRLYGYPDNKRGPSC